jgi:myo-inositol-1(or 4)-monophosphatase
MATFEEEALVALRAVSTAEEILAEPGDRSVVSTKATPRDIVTLLDRRLERHIALILGSLGMPVVGEEAWTANSTLPSETIPYWLVDPIDGTVNFVNGLPYYAISVGLWAGGGFRVGAVSLPAFKELFFTHGEGGAFLNGRRLQAKPASFKEALVGVSFPSRAADVDRAQSFRRFGRVNDQTRGCVRLGSAAATTCQVAAGRLQAAYGEAAKLWDVAGSLAIASQAGCEVWFRPRPGLPELDYVVAVPGVGEPLRALLASEPPVEAKP